MARPLLALGLIVPALVLSCNSAEQTHDEAFSHLGEQIVGDEGEQIARRAVAGCSITVQDDPTKPIPWAIGFGLAFIGLARWRRPR